MKKLSGKDAELVWRYNAHQRDLSPKLLHEMVEIQCSNNSKRTAVISDEKKLTYGDLKKHYNQVTDYLQKKNVRKGTLVAIVMEKGWEQVVGVLGVLKSGAAYLPINATYPIKRIIELLKIGKVTQVLTQQKYVDKLSDIDDVKCASIDDPGFWNSYRQDVPLVTQSADDLAYVIFTSGTTGTPKGVMISHYSAYNTIFNINKKFQVNSNDLFFALSNLEFDLSVYDIFGALGLGASIYLPREKDKKNPDAWRNIFLQHPISIWNSVPSLLQIFVEYVKYDQILLKILLKNIKVILLSGDWISTKLVKDTKLVIPKQANLVSLGGATEASIWSIFFVIKELDKTWKSIPYGSPLTNQQLYVVDENLVLLPPGLSGEIIIAGHGLAIGYWGDSELTRNKFIFHPILGRVYRTGDLGVLKDDGYMRILGRIDDQVKIGGFRVELGEIVRHLEKVPGISEAVAVKYENKMGASNLAAFLKVDGLGTLTISKIKAFLEENVPSHLIPKKIKFITHWPLTSNGKKDYKALIASLNVVSSQTNAEAESLPAKYNQLGIIYQALSNDQANFYLVQTSWAYHEKIDLDIYFDACSELLRISPILRSYFDLTDVQNIRQLVIDDVHFEHDCFDWGEVDSSLAHANWNNWIKLDRLKPIKLDQPATFRLAIAKFSENDYKVLLSMHHAFCDRWSIHLLLQHLHDVYHKKLNHNYEPGCTKKLVRSIVSDTQVAKMNQFWREELSTPVVEKCLSATVFKDKQGLDGPSSIAYQSYFLTPSEKQQLFAVARQLKISPPSFLMACWSVLLSHLLSTNTVCAGFSLSGRASMGEEALSAVGLFSNVVPFLCEIKGEASFSELVKFVQSKLGGFNQNDVISLAEIFNSNDRQDIQENLDHVVVIASSPKFDRNNSLNLPLRNIEFYEVTPYPMMLTICVEDNIRFNFAYNDKFTDQFIRSIALGFVNIIQQAVNDSEVAIKDFCLLDEVEKNNFLDKMQGNRCEALSSKDVFLTILEMCERYPEKIAVKNEGSAYTYRQLMAWVMDLSKTYEKCLNADVVVLYFDRSIEYLVALLLCLKLKIAFIPVSTEVPQKRLEHIMERTNCSVMLSSNQFKPEFSISGVDVYCLEDKLNIKGSKALFGKKVNDVAYIFFTSGSTGEPKGVCISRSSLSAQLNAIISQTGLLAEDLFISMTDVAFDISLLEYLAPIMLGAQLYVPEKSIIHDMKSLSKVITDQDISVIQATPSRWALLAEEARSMKALRVALSGGERLTPKILQKISALNVKIYNLYGPTEATIWATVMPISEEYEDSVPIGFPLTNNCVLVLNAYGKLLPAYVPGELYIGGVGVGLGYVDSSQTQRAFSKLLRFNGRFYKTGDLVYHDGSLLYYLDRLDRQVKVRGYRVDPYEIEACLLKQDQVDQAAVVINEDVIYAFVSPKKIKKKKRMKLGILFFPSLKKEASTADFYDWYLELVKMADELGFDSLWIPERHFDEVGAPYASSTLLAAVFAANTKHIQIRSGSVVLPLHNPLHLVEQWSMIDNLSRGRVGLTVASGWNPNDFILSPGHYENRKNIMFDQVKEIKEIWSSGFAEGVNGLQKDAKVEVFPKTYQKSLDIWVAAAGSPETFSKSGELNLNILTHLLMQDINLLKVHLETYESALKKNGYLRDQNNISLMLHTFVLDDKQQAKAVAAPVMQEYLRQHLSLIEKSLNKNLVSHEMEERIKKSAENFIKNKSLIGGVDDCVDLVIKYYEQGIDELACLIDFGFSRRQIKDSLHYLAKVKNAVNQREFCRPAQIDADELKAQASNILPQYMVPQVITVEADLPLTSNGKVDYIALKERVKKYKPKSLVGEKANKIELTIKKLWVDVLNHDNFSLDDEFFSIGGHSLHAMRLVSLIGEASHIELTLQTFLRHTSIRKLAAYIEHNKGSFELADQLIPQELDKIDLSASQKGLWFLQQLQKKNVAYNDSFLVAIEGEFDEEKLRAVISNIIENQFIFQIKFYRSNRKILQEKADWPAEIFVERIALNYFYPGQSELRTMVDKYAAKPFDLEKDRPYRFVWFSFLNQQFLLIVMHHIITDGGNIVLLLEEIVKQYGNRLIDDVSAPKFDYFDFVCAQKNLIASDRFIQNVSHYISSANIVALNNRLKGIVRPKIITYKGVKRIFKLDSENVLKVKAVIKDSNNSLFSYLLSVYCMSLLDVVEEEELQVGCPVALRDANTFGETFGLFVNMAVINCLKNDVELGFEVFSQLIKSKVGRFLSHQNVPIDLIIDSLKLNRELSFNPLFQYAFSVYEKRDFSSEGNELNLRVLDYDFGIARYDIELQVSTYHDELRFEFIFNSNVVNEEFQNYFVHIFKEKLGFILNDSSCRFDEIKEFHAAGADDYWHQVYERLYSGMSDSLDPSFNISGWVSKADRKMFSLGVMQEWQRNALDKIIALNPKNILEIGCGTGLLAHQLIQRGCQYTGIDFSHSVIGYLRQHLANTKAKLFALKADEIDQLPVAAYDTILMNSVVQYFPNIDYLIEVLGKVCNLFGDKQGAIFIGDVRHYGLRQLEAFYLSQNQFSHLNTPEKKHEAIAKKLGKENELMIEPKFFAYIAEVFPGISHVGILPKNKGQHVSELSLFRYDVVFYVNQQNKREPLDCVICKDAASLDKLFSQTNDQLPNYVRIKNVKNNEMVLFRKSIIESIPEYKNKLPFLPKDLVDMEYAKRIVPSDYLIALEISMENPFCYELVLSRLGSHPILQPSSKLEKHGAVELKTLCNLVEESDSVKKVENLIEDFSTTQHSASVNLISNELEKFMIKEWMELLETDRVKRTDNFFDLGGDSITSIQFVNRLREMGVRITAVDFMENQTVEELINHIQEREVMQ